MKTSLVLLPGTLCDATLWQHQLAHLSDVAEMIVPDIARSDSLAAVARDVLSIAPPQFALAGLSYGGIIAFEMWRQNPERIQRLALLNTTPLPVSETKRRDFDTFWRMAQSGQFREITTDYLKDAMLYRQDDLALRRKVLQMAENVGKTGFLNQVKAQVHRPDSRSTLKTITCPTLILTGREDHVCTVELHELMAREIPGATSVIIEQCGHLSPLEQPEPVTQVMREWLHA